MTFEEPHFWPSREPIDVDYNEGNVISVPQHYGSVIRLRKTDPEYNATDHMETSFNKLSEKELCPEAGVLDKINLACADHSWLTWL